MTDATATVLALGLVLGTLGIMASHTLAPVRERPKGEVELEVVLPFVQRVLAQRRDVLAVCGVVAISGGALTSQRVLSPIFAFITLGVMLGLLMKRRTLVLTSKGILIHSAAFRPWKDFDDVHVANGKVQLHSSTRLATVNVYLPPQGREETIRLIRRHVTGRVTPRNLPDRSGGRNARAGAGRGAGRAAARGRGARAPRRAGTGA